MKSVLLMTMLLSNAAVAMTLPEYMATVEKKNRNVQALNVSQENVNLMFLREDRIFVPYFAAGASYLTDKSPSNQFIFMGASEAKITKFSAAVGKRFSSGTAFELSANVTETQAPGLVLPTFSPPFSTGSLGVSLTQSLWKDFFGEATRLRYERQDSLGQAQRSEYDFKKRQTLNAAESAFWDYLYATESLKIARNSLDRGKRIENWTRRRVSDGIGDRADLYQAQALVAGRQMMLISAEDDLAAAKRTIRDALELAPEEPIPELVGNISQPRPLNADLVGRRGKIIQIEAYVESLNAKAMAVQAKETENEYLPDLVLDGGYNTNSLEKSMSQAAQKWGETTRPTAHVGLTFTYLFDTDVKRGAQEAARGTALASKLLSERKMLESESAWIELNRRYSEMSKKVEALEQVSNLRNQYAKAQGELFNKGRSITNTVITAEEDAASSELELMKLRSEQRKMETQGRLFVVIEE